MRTGSRFRKQEERDPLEHWRRRPVWHPKLGNGQVVYAGARSIGMRFDGTIYRAPTDIVLFVLRTLDRHFDPEDRWTNYAALQYDPIEFLARTDYVNRCWRCAREGKEQAVNSLEDPTCVICRWVICPACGACQEPPNDHPSRRRYNWRSEVATRKRVVTWIRNTLEDETHGAAGFLPRQKAL